MKKIKFFLLIILTATAVSCSNDEAVETLDGTWHLRTAKVPQGTSIDYNDGEVYWIFNQQSHRLTVQNNVNSFSPQNILSGLGTGTYTYTVVTEGDIKTLYVEGNEQGIFAYTDENLVINTAPDATGLIKIFER